MFRATTILSVAISLALLAAACGDNENPASTTPEPAERVFSGGRIYTANEQQPWAEATAVSDGRFVFVGSNSDVERYVGPATSRHDLGGRLVIPGIIDAHTHPGLVAILGGEDEDPIPKTSLEDIQEWLRGYVAVNDDPIVFAGSWPNELFGVEGPRKEWLDEVAPDRLITLFDESGHSQWMNSLTLRALGVDANTPDPAPGLSEFVRDPSGEPTGWVKEFAAVRLSGDLLLPEEDELRRELFRFIELLADHGVTSLLDAGNLQFHDIVYGMLAERERAGELPLRYEGAYHIFLPDQVDGAIDEVNRLRREYGGERLTFNTIKIHFDGVIEIRTAGMLEPFADDPQNDGATLLTGERVTQLLLDMQGQEMNLHLHTVGDRAVRTALDAVAAARTTVGGALDSRVTVSHIEMIADSDLGRFSELDVVANFTPHWHGEFGQHVTESATAAPLGPERANRKHRARVLHDAGAVVTYSSDVTTIPDSQRSSPFFGMQVGHTRQEPELGSDAPVFPPAGQRLSLEQLVQGYTRNAAYQFGWEDRLGSIEAGKLADMVVLDRNLFEVSPYEIANTKPAAVVMEGDVVRGSFPR